MLGFTISVMPILITSYDHRKGLVEMGCYGDEISRKNLVLEVFHYLILRVQQDSGAGVKDLCINTEEAIVNVKNLFAELILLRKHLEKVCDL